MPVIMAFETVVARQLSEVAVPVEEGGDLLIAGAERVIVAGSAYHSEAIAPLPALVDGHAIHPQHVAVQAKFEALVPEAVDAFAQIDFLGSFDTPDPVDFSREVDGFRHNSLAVGRGKVLIQSLKKVFQCATRIITQSVNPSKKSIRQRGYNGET